MQTSELWIGLDNGATNVRGRLFRCHAKQEGGPAWQACGTLYLARHDRSVGPGGDPAALAQGYTREIVELARRALSDAADQPERAVAGAGLASYGLPDVAARSIVRARHGPVLPDLMPALERALGAAVAARDVHGLFADGLAALAGECEAPDGALSAARSGYLMHAGTGVAEALLVDGAARTLDQMEPAWPKAWQSDLAGENVEDLFARGALERVAGDPAELDRRAILLGRWIESRRAQFVRAGVEPLERVVLCAALWTHLCAPAARALRLQSELGGALELVPSRLTQAALIGAAVLARRARGLERGEGPR